MVFADRWPALVLATLPQTGVRLRWVATGSCLEGVRGCALCVGLFLLAKLSEAGCSDVSTHRPSLAGTATTSCSLVIYTGARPAVRLHLAERKSLPGRTPDPFTAGSAVDANRSLRLHALTGTHARESVCQNRLGRGWHTSKGLFKDQM